MSLYSLKQDWKKKNLPDHIILFPYIANTIQIHEGNSIWLFIYISKDIKSHLEQRARFNLSLFFE